MTVQDFNKTNEGNNYCVICYAFELSHLWKMSHCAERKVITQKSLVFIVQKGTLHSSGPCFIKVVINNKC